MPTSVLIENSLLLWPMRARRGLTSAPDRGLPLQWRPKLEQREVLALGLEHDDLRHHLGRPGCRRGFRGRKVVDAVRVVTVVVQDVPDDPQPGAAMELQHGAEP